jgi:transposase-like protein
VLSEDERRILENWAKRRSTAQGLALRARIVLACAEGHGNTAVAARLGVSQGTVRRWRARFLAKRLDGLGDEPRPGYRESTGRPDLMSFQTELSLHRRADGVRVEKVPGIRAVVRTECR